MYKRQGFKGYTLTAEQQQSTVGVRLVLAENTAAREAAAAAGDLSAPKIGEGVSASADIRSFRLDWQLRDTARTTDGSLKWVKEKNTSFNCDGASSGCVDNVFAATGIRTDGSSDTDTANDTIQLLDGTTNVDLVKQVQLIDATSGLPTGTPGDSVSMIVPNPGELAAQDYPRARYTLTAKNSSTAPSGAKGAMKLAKLRLTDTSGPVDVDINASQFAGRNYAEETSSPGNHFDTFNLTGVSYGPLPAYIDTTESTVELWIYNGTPTGDVYKRQRRKRATCAPETQLPTAWSFSPTTRTLMARRLSSMSCPQRSRVGISAILSRLSTVSAPE